MVSLTLIVIFNIQSEEHITLCTVLLILIFVLYTVLGTGCNPAWSISANTYASGGSSRAAFTTDATCLAGCLADSTCLGVDLDKNGGTLCWFHTNPTLFAIKLGRQNVEHQVLDRCPTGKL